MAGQRFEVPVEKAMRAHVQKESNHQRTLEPHRKPHKHERDQEESEQKSNHGVSACEGCEVKMESSNRYLSRASVLPDFEQ